jgi:hypothetical protein
MCATCWLTAATAGGRQARQASTAQHNRQPQAHIQLQLHSTTARIKHNSTYQAQHASSAQKNKQPHARIKHSRLQLRSTTTGSIIRTAQVSCAAQHAELGTTEPLLHVRDRILHMHDSK